MEVCKKAEQVLLHGGDNSLEVDAGVKHVVFALITLVSSNSQLRRLRDNNDDSNGPGVDNRVVNAVVDGDSQVREGHKSAEVKSQLETIGLKGEFSLKLLHTDLNFPDLS